jgi:hypothetical protein
MAATVSSLRAPGLLAGRKRAAGDATMRIAVRLGAGDIVVSGPPIPALVDFADLYAAQRIDDLAPAIPRCASMSSWRPAPADGGGDIVWWLPARPHSNPWRPAKCCPTWNGRSTTR